MVELKYLAVLISLLVQLTKILAQNKDNENFVCLHEQYYNEKCKIKPRRHDILDFGFQEYFNGWADVQGQGAANDYCRILGKPPDVYLSCALAGTKGDNDRNYNSAKYGFDPGHNFTWYMKDEDGDGRDDYCRCMGQSGVGFIIYCTKAGQKGFYGSTDQPGPTNTFSPSGPLKHACTNNKVSPETGIAYRN